MNLNANTGDDARHHQRPHRVLTTTLRDGAGTISFAAVHGTSGRWHRDGDLWLSEAAGVAGWARNRARAVHVE